MNNLTSQLRHDWFILVSLVSKDFKLKYRRSILGVIWSVLNPLMMMIVMWVVFDFLNRGDAETRPFAVYLILGSTLFNMMSASTTSGASSILDAASLIKKIRINKMLFPVEKALFELVNFALSLVAVFVVLIIFKITLTWNLLYLPLLLFYVLLFCSGLSLLLSALAVFFSDIIYLWGVVITAWTYVTPLFYSIRILPEAVVRLMRFNPMYHFITYFRSVVMCGTPPGVHDLLISVATGQPVVSVWQPPGLHENLVCLAFGVITFAVGYVVFRATEKRFVLFV